MEVPHLGEHVRSDLGFVTKFLQDSVEFVGDRLCWIVGKESAAA